MSKETNRVMGHADEADGIEEYDNPLPDWWLGLFWLTIVWAIGYGVHYHFIGNRSQEGRLAAEMAAAEARWPQQAQAALAFSYSDAAADAGEAVYNQNCFPCHGMQMEGGIGPSFVDEEWIHGGQAENIIRVIREGVLDKGMVAWEGVLSPEQINNVAAYVIRTHAAATDRDIDDILEPATPDGMAAVAPPRSRGDEGGTRVAGADY